MLRHHDALQVARYLPNPEKNWGPKPKHGRTLKVGRYSH